MNTEFKFITVLDFKNGKVHVHQYSGSDDVETYVSHRYHMDNVQYMVHDSAPSLFVDDLYYCTRKEAYDTYYED